MDPQLDHDLLVELRTEMKGVRADLREIKDNTTSRLSLLEQDHITVKEFSDHENRLRTIEDKRLAKIENKLAYWAGALVVINLLAGYLITKYL